MNETKIFISSTVQSGSYNSESKVLTITFKGAITGKTKDYEYANVPPEVWEGMKAAESVGRYLVSNVKDIYSYKAI